MLGSKKDLKLHSFANDNGRSMNCDLKSSTLQYRRLPPVAFYSNPILNQTASRHHAWGSLTADWREKMRVLPETRGTVSLSHATTVTYFSTEEGIMHLKTATLPLMAVWSATRTVYGSRKTARRKTHKHRQIFMRHELHETSELVISGWNICLLKDGSCKQNN